ncbi:ParA family protein [Nakamurella silvestris]|nr:ParA family protein [Nakamurella silvestris]
MSAPDDAAWIAAAGAPRTLPSYATTPSRPASQGHADHSDATRRAVEAVSAVEEVAVDPAFVQDQDVEGPEDYATVVHVSAQESAAAFSALFDAPVEPEATELAAPAPEAPASPAPPAPAVAPEPELGPTGRPYRVIPEPAPVDRHGPARVIAMCNQKGGVGKTTSTINLGAALAQYGRRVLLVDLDPQGALSAGLGVQSHQLDRTIYNLMLERSTTLADVLVPTKIEGLDLLPANIDLSAAEVQLISEVGREQTLGRALRPVLHDYDYILIDCQPSLGLLTVNALACAHAVLMPVAAEYFSLRGVALLVDTIDKVQERLNPDLTVDGVLVTMFDGRTVHSREVVATLVEQFGDQLYDTVIARTVKFPEATVAGDPITTYAPSSAAATAYRNLAKEVIAHDAH